MNSSFFFKKLTELGEEFDVKFMEERILNLKAQQKVISNRVLQLILEKRNECSKEFDNVNGMKQKIQESVWVCQKARAYLCFAKQNLTCSSLEIIANFRKKKTLENVLKVLKFFQELKSTNEKIQEMLRSGNYAEAISILLLFNHQTEKYSELTCTDSLKQTLQQTLDEAEVSLDNALSGITQKRFDQNLYENLHNGYKLLNKTHLAMDQLMMNFISAIHTNGEIYLHI